jgi:nucleoside-diphosphate-sugar epimerase
VNGRHALVTGGTGFAGSSLVRALVAHGAKVTVISRDRHRALEVLPPSVTVVEGDVTSPGFVEEAMAGVELVFHLATAFREPGLPDSRYRAVHVDGTRYLLEAAAREGVERFVHCSTVGVHGHVVDPPADESSPFSPGDIYQVTKLEGERAALDFHTTGDLSVSVARPTAIYGPGDRRLLKLFRMVRQRRFAMLGDGAVFYHMIFVDDLVSGLLLLSEHPAAAGDVFILGGPDYTTLRELVRSIAQAEGVSAPRMRLPVAPFYALGAVCEVVCRPLGIAPPIFRRRVDFFTKSRAFSIEKARSVLGFEPAVGLREGLSRCVEWYRAEGLLS